MSVTEIGLNLSILQTGDSLGIGVMFADFHCNGTTCDLIDRLKTN